ncbi:hypothetical protein GIB67_017787 [Kingdonia uniflora]|uniref:Embryo-specific protein 3 n=1 Tax=Kingdonia uniflora TaxID=39325 RepID=A0A7J7MP41_9MAGN|nr:hypothetical protein GIB67_017787 [Kingdonia uniflora]
MLKPILLLLLLFISSSTSQSNPTSLLEPKRIESLTIQSNEHLTTTCYYDVYITTSCSSPTYTRDQISISFGDAYGYQVYAPRIDDPRSGAFERCSTDTYRLSGPCMYQICYLYLYRTGSDGWKPESVTVYQPSWQPAYFYYNTYVPYGVWFGFNYCNNVNVVKAAAAAAA